MKIGVIGSMNIDKVAMVDHIPLKGETLLATNYLETFGGKGANQAIALARLGADISMFGCVGKDGDAIIKHMRDEGVVMDHIDQIHEVNTGCAFINVGQGDNAIVVVQGANSYLSIDYLKERADVLEAMDLILIQNEIPTSTINYVLMTYGGTDKIIIYNPAPFKKIDPAALSKATYITPNEHEVLELKKEGLVAIEKEALIITKGAFGADYYQQGAWHNVPASKCSPIDSTGAGDTFNGALAYGISLGKPIGEAIRFANTAAGISTEKEGAQIGMPTIEMVDLRL